MAHHVLGGGRGQLHGSFSRSARPVLTVASGDTVSFTVPDVSWGLEPPVSVTLPRKKVEDRENGPCLCGPVAVDGARPGDTLEVVIERVKPTAWGWTYSGAGMSRPGLNARLGIGEAPLTLVRWEVDEAAGVVRGDHGQSAPLRPFPGTIGLCPDEELAGAWEARACGGNMDCREIVEGAVLLLPVMVAGGLLSVGDGHAAQGDGEVAGTAVECGLEELRVRVRVRRDVVVKTPRVWAGERWVTIGVGPDLESAAVSAMSEMLDVMEGVLGLGRAESLAVASAQVSLRITQMVNPAVGVHAVWKGVSPPSAG